jgi:ribosomal protein S18 acetylase RimI-like enzyme
MTYPSSRITIVAATVASQELIRACQQLVPQLGRNHQIPTLQELTHILSEGASTLFVGRHEDFGDEIVGMATLVLYRVPTGLRGYIEDVIVDEKARGRGIGEALMRACLDKADQAGCPQVMLTCNPSRAAANRLYLRMGFVLRKTNVYRYLLKRAA